VLGRAEDASHRGLWLSIASTTPLTLGQTYWVDVLSEEFGSFTVAAEVRYLAGRRVGLETKRPIPMARPATT
jgi:hypothetical protein